MSEDSIIEHANKLIIEAIDLMSKTSMTKEEIAELTKTLESESLGGIQYQIKLLKRKAAENKKAIQSVDISATSLDPNTITIRESCGRAREDLGDIEELAASLLLKGQIQPILITRDNELIAGERRLRACQSIPMSVLVIYRDQVDDITMKELELEENIYRKDMTWQERATLTADLTKLKQDKHGKKGAGDNVGWSHKDTATLMGKSHSKVQEDIELAKAIEMIPELKKAKTAEDAKKVLRGIEEKLLLKALIEREKDKPKAYDFADEHYIIGDALLALPKLPDSTLDFADVDTPYGIDLPNIKKSQIETLDLKKIGNYKEWPREKYLEICEYVANEVYRILKKDAWCTWWFGLDYYTELKEMLQDVGFSLDPIPSMWYAGAKAAQTNQPQIMLGKSYDTFFLLRKGKPVLHKPGRHNVFEGAKVDADKKIHPTEKPLSVYTDIVKTIVFPGAKCIVPFQGSGNATRALYSHNCTAFGYDLDSDIKNKFLLRVEQDVEDKLYGGE